MTTRSRVPLRGAALAPIMWAAAHPMEYVSMSVAHNPTIGLGCMRLSTAPDRDEARAIAVIHAALDAGATLLDTADAYCHDETETGHNERLIAAALRA